MREIKFRGFEHGVDWVYGSLCINRGIHYIIEDTTAAINYLVEPKSVGQFTGLKDKNGKEIYEGDILTGRNMIKKIVKWDEKAACFIYEEQFKPKPYRISFDEMNTKFKTTFVKDLMLPNHAIIGNIYENPELLNSEQKDKRSVATKLNQGTKADPINKKETIMDKVMSIEELLKPISKYYKLKSGRVVEAVKHFVGTNKNMFEVKNNCGCVFYECAIPATEADYITYLNSQTK